MSSPRNKKGATAWILCEKCKANVTHSDTELHSKDCPPNLLNITHNFVLNETLYGTVDIKTNEEIKGVTRQESNNFVFLSQSVIQLCGLSIGEHAIVSDVNNTSSACRVWPTVEKSLTSVLFTKIGAELTFAKDCKVTVTKINFAINPARQIVLKTLNNTNIEISPDLLNRIHRAHLNHLLAKTNKISIVYFGLSLMFEIVDISPVNLSSDNSQFYKVVDSSIWKVFRKETEYLSTKISVLNKIGGLDNEIAEIREVMNAALGKSKVLSGAIVNRGVLLYGAPGTGKTLIVNALISETDVFVANVNTLNISEEELASVFKDAQKRAPSIIVLDDIDTLCPARNSRLSDFEKKVIANLLNFFDCINKTESSKVFVVAMSNKPDSIDASFRRCGRLDREIEIPTPNQIGRLDILKKLLSDIPHNISREEFKEIADVAHGFVGTDLVALCARATLHARNKLTFQDLKFALTRVRPSAMREVQIEVPNVKWSDIGGQDGLKLILRQAVEWPLKHPESFVRLGITPPRGVLMFGPPGCSKTMIAKALATESGLNFLSIKGPELFSKWVGESERAVREVFRKARQVAPSVIFFDEIDALGGERSSGSNTSVQERVLAQLLTELDGVTPLGDVTVLAATNRPDKIDKALLRPGRLDRIVHVPLPDSDTRREIFKLKTGKMPVVEIHVEDLVRLTEGYSGAEVNAVCHEAAMKALEESLEADTVEMRHFIKALEIVTPRTPSSLLNIYKEYLK